MTRTRRFRLLGIFAALALVLAACGDDDDDNGTTTGAEDTGGNGNGEEGAWAVSTDDCPDESVDEPIEDTIRIGTTMPLSGGVAAVAFAPVAAGLEAYVEYANENDIVEGYELELFIEDDQFNESLTPAAVERLLDSEDVHLFAGMIGTANNQAVRDLLNEECYPQLLANTGAPIWGEVADYPWTTGGLPPYNAETAVYVRDMEEEFPDGATAAVFHIALEFGESYAETFEELAPEAGFEIVSTQTVEGGDESPPTSQVTAIANAQPDIILAVPLGAQCPALLSELANAKAANPGWEPLVYMTATCASTLILAVAGDAADEMITSAWTVDANDEAFQDIEEVATFMEEIDSITDAHQGDYSTASVGWTNGEITAEILNQAAQSPDGLTRASIINAARNFEYTAQLHREGITLQMDGEQDPYMLESMQVVQYDADTGTLEERGPVITDFEGQSGELPGAP
jgi:branched-chain amino acid transport system substrate-binding protein